MQTNREKCPFCGALLKIKFFNVHLETKHASAYRLDISPAMYSSTDRQLIGS